MKKASSKKNGYHSDDETTRYKINKNYLNNSGKSPSRNCNKDESDDENILYRFPTVLSKPKPEIKPKPRIKVNFWSNRQGSRLHNADKEKEKANRRHTLAVTQNKEEVKPKSSVKVRKRVSFLPSPVIFENHNPMVTVPDDLTVQFNEEEANVLKDDLNQAFCNSSINNKKSSNNKRKSNNSPHEHSPGGSKKKLRMDDLDTKSYASENELEFFTKYVVQKLRRMETNQRIYSENLINTVLMLGQLGKLNGKSKVTES